MSVLQKQFSTTIIPTLKEQLSVANIMQVPEVKKVTVNVGYGRHHKDKAFIENVEKTLLAITGQKPVHNKAKKSISNFKIREGMDIGMSVTLRGDQMYEFLYRLINLALPRVRDFRGLSVKAFDRQGNYAIGLKESIAFPEVNAEHQDKIHGLQIVVSKTTKNKEEGIALLKALGMPLKDAK